MRNCGKLDSWVFFLRKITYLVNLPRNFKSSKWKLANFVKGDALHTPNRENLPHKPKEEKQKCFLFSHKAKYSQSNGSFCWQCNRNGSIRQLHSRVHRAASKLNGNNKNWQTGRNKVGCQNDFTFHIRPMPCELVNLGEMMRFLRACEWRIQVENQALSLIITPSLRLKSKMQLILNEPISTAGPFACNVWIHIELSFLLSQCEFHIQIEWWRFWFSVGWVSSFEFRIGSIW